MLNTFWTYCIWALQFLAAEYFRWVSIGILAALSIAIVVTFKSRAARLPPKASYLFPLLLLAGFLLTIAIGVLFRVPPRTSPNHLGSLLLDASDVVALAFAIYCIYRAKGIRWFTAALVVTELWMILAAGLIAGMAVSGDWL